MAANSTDLLIIGAGLAGIAAATAAVRQGQSVTLVSAHDRHPPDFRGEKLAAAQMDALDRLGLGQAARAQMTAVEGVWSYRFGHLAQKSPEREYSSDYSDLVNALGDALPREVNRITGRISAIATGPDLQSVTLNDGRVFSGRVLAIATGLSDAIRRMLGMERNTISPGHSLSIGFDVEEPASDFAFPSMVWGREPDPLLSYLTLFPIGEKLRGNLFVYRDVASDWTREFRRSPQAGLRRLMPRLADRIGRMTLKSEIAVRPIDVVETRNIHRDGVVLLGDAFSVICPVTGLGMAKAINDAERLVHHLPALLAAPEVSAGRLSVFYQDPLKTALDSRALSDSLSGRRAATGDSPYWQARRFAGGLMQRVRDAIFVDTGPLKPADGVAAPLAARERIG